MRACDSRIRHDYVQFSEVLCYLLNGALDILLVANICLVCGCLDVVGSCDLGRNGVGILGRVVDDCNLLLFS